MDPQQSVQGEEQEFLSLMLLFMWKFTREGCMCMYACVSALWGGADVCVSFAEGSPDNCLQGHPDGSGLHHCRLTSAVPEPWPARLINLCKRRSLLSNYLLNKKCFAGVSLVVLSIVVGYLYIFFFMPLFLYVSFAVIFCYIVFICVSINVILKLINFSNSIRKVKLTYWFIFHWQIF